MRIIRDIVRAFEMREKLNVSRIAEPKITRLDDLNFDYLAKKLFKSLNFFLYYIFIIGMYFRKFSYKIFLQLSYKKILTGITLQKVSNK